MTDQFGRIYAKYYDTLYRDKDYHAECDVINQIFRRHNLTVKSILDVGCGTGNHLIPLTEMGYYVVGVDTSSDMLKILQQKICPQRYKRIYESRIQDFDITDTFDAVISMFAVLNYITDTDELLQTLRNIHRFLNPGGLFIFDIWYGPAVTWVKPNARVKSVVDGDVTVERIVVPEWDLFNHTIKSHYTLRAFRGTEILDDVREIHTLRYFFPQEIIYLLEHTGFEVLSFSEFMDLDKPPSMSEWDAMIVARAV